MPIAGSAGVSAELPGMRINASAVHPGELLPAMRGAFHRIPTDCVDPRELKPDW
jgi:hypothetical protein